MQEADENFEGNSNLLLQSWTHTVEEKLQLKLQGQSWKQGVWSKEEIEQLKQNILEFCEVLFDLDSHLAVTILILNALKLSGSQHQRSILHYFHNGERRKKRFLQNHCQRYQQTFIFSVSQSCQVT